MKLVLCDIVKAIGFVAVVSGLAAAWWPLALIVGGALVVLVAESMKRSFSAVAFTIVDPEGKDV